MGSVWTGISLVDSMQNVEAEAAWSVFLYVWQVFGLSLCVARLTAYCAYVHKYMYNARASTLR